jgi:hypothetical protein
VKTSIFLPLGSQILPGGCQYQCINVITAMSQGNLVYCLISGSGKSLTSRLKKWLQILTRIVKLGSVQSWVNRIICIFLTILLCRLGNIWSHWLSSVMATVTFSQCSASKQECNRRIDVSVLSTVVSSTQYNHSEILVYSQHAGLVWLQSWYFLNSSCFLQCNA